MDRGRRFERGLAVVGAAALLIVGFDSVTYAATGSSLLQGRVNKSSAVTTVQNTGKGSALNLVTKSASTPPFTTNAKGLVKNLYAARAASADKLGGLTLAQVQAAAKGATGAAGLTGPAGPLLSVLASGQTVTGAYGVEDTGVAGDFHGALIAYPFPVATTPTFVFVPQAGPNPDATHCAGTAAAPTAATGFLCVYEGVNTDAAFFLADTPTGSFGAGKTGTWLQIKSTGPGAIVDLGTWALTAA